LYSIGASAGFISKQTGDRIKTLESNDAKYWPEADTTRDFVEEQIRKSGTLPKPRSKQRRPPLKAKTKKPLVSQGL
jgi:hypothetical protein